MNKIWIVDKQRSYSNGMKNLIEISLARCSIEIYDSDDDFYLSNLDEMPDLIILDPMTKNRSFLSDVDLLRKKGIKIAILTMNKEKKESLKYLGKDVQGLLFKDMSTRELINAIENILAGNRYIHPSMSDLILDAFRNVAVK